VQTVVESIKLRWPLPTVPGPAQLTLWFFLLGASVVLLVAVGVIRTRHDPSDIKSRIILAVAAFSVGIFPQMLQRDDSTHLAWVACVGIAFVPVAGVELLRGRLPTWTPRAVGLLSGALVLALLTFVLTDFTVRKYADYSAQSFGHHRRSFEITNRGRNFFYGRADDARAADQMLAVVDRIAKPGEKLIVGPDDFRRIPENDAFFYHLLPQLTPGTRYLEMDPDLANRSDSGLADEVRRADILILSSAYDYVREPNDASKLGSNKPNVVVKRDFCLVGKYGPHYQLLRRCHR
jgi:hypothetical protein